MEGPMTASATTLSYLHYPLYNATLGRTNQLSQ